MKIWIVYQATMWEGCTPPEAVFSTKEAAEEWVASAFDGTDAEIDEFTVDEIPEWSRKK